MLLTHWHPQDSPASHTSLIKFSPIQTSLCDPSESSLASSYPFIFPHSPCAHQRYWPIPSFIGNWFPQQKASWSRDSTTPGQGIPQVLNKHSSGSGVNLNGKGISTNYPTTVGHSPRVFSCNLWATCQGRTHYPHFQTRKLRVLCFVHQLLTQCLKQSRYYMSVLKKAEVLMKSSTWFYRWETCVLQDSKPTSHSKLAQLEPLSDPRSPDSQPSTSSAGPIATWISPGTGNCSCLPQHLGRLLRSYAGAMGVKSETGGHFQMAKLKGD